MSKIFKLEDLKCREDIYKLKICKPSRKEMLRKAIDLFCKDYNIPDEFKHKLGGTSEK